MPIFFHFLRPAALEWMVLAKSNKFPEQPCTESIFRDSLIALNALVCLLSNSSCRVIVCLIGLPVARKIVLVPTGVATGNKRHKRADIGFTHETLTNSFDRTGICDRVGYYVVCIGLIRVVRYVIHVAGDYPFSQRSTLHHACANFAADIL